MAAAFAAPLQLSACRRRVLRSFLSSTSSSLLAPHQPPPPLRRLPPRPAPVCTAASSASPPPAHAATESAGAVPAPPPPSPLPAATDMRTHTCGELHAGLAGNTVTLTGWAHAVRDKGGVVFILLRDRFGLVQATLDEAQPGCTPDLVAAAKQVRLEYVVSVSGVVQLRSSAAINRTMSTGDIEVQIRSLDIVSRTRALPFMVNESSGTASPAQEDGDTKLKFRYLALRQPSLQSNLVLRHRAALAVRNYLDRSRFVEVETPALTRATPEGARDYLIPSRVHAGKFYALPQSPQIYKQLLMVSGLDRYFQIAKCFRDEDLRFDRQPEFTQIDLELSFVRSKRAIMDTAYGVVHAMFDAAGLAHVLPPAQFPVMSYTEAMRRFGVDNPDTRFGMELVDLTDAPAVRASAFKPVTAAFEAHGTHALVKAFVVAGGAKSVSRKVIDGYTAFVKDYGLSGLLYGKVDGTADVLTVSGPLSKVTDAPHELLHATGAAPGDLVLMACGAGSTVNAGLGKLRVRVSSDLELVEDGAFAFTWVVDFPLFEWDEDAGRHISIHHPFTAPLPEHADWLRDPSRLTDILSDSYDLVCNGSEIGGGSLRIHNPDVQQAVFAILGIGPDEQRDKFGFLLDALTYGPPPHGGMAFGLDRCVMLMCGADSIRDVVAFPKTTSAADLMAGAPAPVAQQQLDELSVRSTAPQSEEDGTKQ